VRFQSLAVRNLRAIRRFEVDDLGSFVVVAGQNGSGKSCVFDAIRLLKSVYGGYSTNEYHQWFGEFAVDLGSRQSLRKLFRSADESIRISATISFADTELEYIRTNLDSLVQPIAWQQVTGQPVDYWTFSRVALATQMRRVQPELTAAAQQLASEVSSELNAASYTLSVQIMPSGEMDIAPCKPAEVAFQTYAPQHLGVIEFHSASRTYTRQQVAGINLDTRALDDQRRQQSLYNWQNKYQNVKSELATSYVRSIIAAASGSAGASDDLNETLKELFVTFFPDKTYEGVVPDPHGSIDFPVRLSTGEVHDIDDLSSGEKEILYGYLKLKNSTPRESVILLDEPELHLNPSLLQGFADFYYRHLGIAQGNQLWLVTHSDTLLRQAVGNTNYRVYQMVPATATSGSQNQAVEVVADDDVERVTIELVGDLASYRPHGKVVILEGRSENAFDVNLVKRLFPDFARRVNLVSGGNKRRVRDLYDALQQAASQAGIRNRFFAVVDKDSESVAPSESGASAYSWDVYHIENYLLDAGSIRSATATLLNGADSFATDEDMWDVLRDCAGELIDGLVLERLQGEVNDLLVSAIKLGGPSDGSAPAQALLPSVEGSVGRVRSLGESLTIEDLTSRANEHRSALEASLQDASWRREFPGRAILARYVQKRLSGKINPVLFNNTVLDKMVERGVKPPSMQSVVDAILSR
jgi:predicted ATPase